MDLRQKETEEVLVVEDDPDFAALLRGLLESHGYRTHLSATGEEGLEYARTTSVALILLDLMLPGKSGASVLRQLKKAPELAKIPVVVISGASEATGVDITTGKRERIESFSEQYSRSVGSRFHKRLSTYAPDEVLEKPIDQRVFFETVDRLLSDSREAMPLG